MVLYRMNMLGLCTVFYLMTIFGVDVCEAECGEYIIVFEERTCHHNNHYKLKPLNKEQINLNNLTYLCNSTNKDQGKKTCLMEFDCRGKQQHCQNHVIPKNFQHHSFIADNHIATPTTAADNLVVTRIESTTEAVGLPTTAADNVRVTRVESTTEAVSLSTTTPNNHTVTPVEIATEAVDLPTTAAANLTVTPVESTTKAVGVFNNNITVEQELHRKVHEVFNPIMHDVNIIYIQKGSDRTNEKSKPRNQIIQCKFAEIVCVDEGKPKNYSISDFENGTYDTHLYEPPENLQIEITRDETSTVQPLFTGYFPESSNDSTTNYNYDFQGIMTTLCPIQKDGNCKQNINSLKYINIYLEANYVKNNTITKYLNCTQDSVTPKNLLIVKCEDVSFAKHNQHILQGPPLKQELWNCQITELRNTSPLKEQRSENSEIHFINCDNETKNINKINKYEDVNVVPISDIKNVSGMKINKTEISPRKEITNTDISSTTNLQENIITILITENPNNCSHNSSLNINEGKIIDLGLNNIKGRNFQNNNLDITLSNCINEHSSIINNKQSPSKAELIIILKNESLNTSNLKQFNGTLEEESVKQRILLRCDHNILNLGSNTTSNTTKFKCESIDLDLYNITGIEITPTSQIANKTTVTKSENETKQELATWNCMILEEQQKNKIHFGNCYKDLNINDSKNKSGENITMAISDKKADIPSGKRELNKANLSQPRHMIKISITEKVNNCSNNSFLSIDGGKIIDFGVFNKTKEILENNHVELKLSNCLNVKSSTINETQADSKDLTIVLKSESLNTSDLEQFNEILKERSVKQRILLRCEHPNLDSSVNISSNMAVLQCESIDLDLYNITGIEIVTNATQPSPVNNSTEKKKANLKNDQEIDTKTKVNPNSKSSTNQTVGNNDRTVNNKSNKNKTKVVEINEVQKNIPESNNNFKNQNFNRRKDIPDGMGQNSLGLESAETEKILLVALLSIAGGAILIVIVLRVCTKKKEYNPAPTREPPDEEETAF